MRAAMGFTPIHMAASQGHWQTVAALLANGASLAVRIWSVAYVFTGRQSRAGAIFEYIACRVMFRGAHAEEDTQHLAAEHALDQILTFLTFTPVYIQCSARLFSAGIVIITC